jgi:hypothetical protein
MPTLPKNAFLLRLIQIISDSFDFQRNTTLVSIMAFVATSVILGCSVNNLSSAFVLLAKFLVDKKSIGDKEGWTVLFSIVIPVLLLIFIGTFLWLNYDRNQRKREMPNFVCPEPHQGLILMLSTYNPYTSKYKEIEGIKNYLHQFSGLSQDSRNDMEPADPEQKIKEFRDEILKSNLGPLFAAVELHSPSLEHCWFVATKETVSMVDLATELASYILKQQGRAPIPCTPVLLNDTNSIEASLGIIHNIYSSEPAKTIGTRNIIADFTGGNKAMSAGMILAALGPEFALQYLRKDSLLRKGEQDGKVYICSADEIKTRNIILTVPVSLLSLDGKRHTIID